MEQILLTPGPTPLPPCVREALARPVIHHRTSEFSKIFSDVVSGLQYVFRTKNTVLVLPGTGTSGMEACVVNLMSPGDSALVLSCGVFGQRWARILDAYSIAAKVIEDDPGNASSSGKLLSELRGSGRKYKAVFFTHVETSTGVLNPVREISRLIRENSGALAVVDAVSSLAAEPLETEDWGIDAAVSASQKGLMNSPGLAFTALSERALKAARSCVSPRFYYDFRAMLESSADSQMPYTAPVSLVAAQAQSLSLIRAEGIENVWARTAQNAAFARTELSRMGFDIFPRTPSSALTTALVPRGLDAGKLVRYLAERHGVRIAGGQAGLKNKIVRVAHMGYAGKSYLRKGLDAIEKTVKEINANGKTA